MLIVPLRAAGVEIREIRVAGGQSDFCEEFFDDVRVPAENVVGGFNHGWATASALLIHERDTVGGNSQYANVDDEAAGDGTSMAELATLAFAARARGETGTFERVADAWVRDYAHLCLVDRIVALVADGSLPAEAGALLKLSAAMRGAHRDDIALELSGTDAVLGEPNAAEPYEFGRRFLMRQAMCLAGGSNEMQQNLISERLLGLPREHRPDIGLSFSEIPSGRDRHR
jgi:alkylation response protein AidB-like acyl-CoA dehydrogenase